MGLLGYSSRVTLSTRTNPFHSLHIHAPHLPNSVLSLPASSMQPNRSGSKRPTCPKCSKPTLFCLCTRIKNPGGIENKVGVIILQHSLEQKHPLNSARILKLGLRNAGIYSVSDVNFGAKFFIRVLGMVFGERLDFYGLEREIRDTQKRKFENFCGFSEYVCEESLSVKKSEFCDGELRKSDANEETFNEKIIVKNVLQVSNEVVIVASIKKFGMIADIDCKFSAKDSNRKSNYLDQILQSGEVLNALRSGFAVKKMQMRQVNGSTTLEVHEEFDIVVRSGTVLLFPSENAVTIDELKAMNVEVRNLIVLDGTWSKAKRMYNENPWLRFLPHLKLDVDQRSLYSEVRKQPEAGCLSTIESVVHTLKAAGDDADGLDNLLDVFESMVRDQRRCKDERLARSLRDE